MGKKRDEIIPYSENKNCFKINKEPIETLKRDEIIPYSESYKEPFKSFNINLGLLDKKKDERVIPYSESKDFTKIYEYKNYFKLYKEPKEPIEPFKGFNNNLGFIDKKKERVIPYIESKDFTKIYKEPFKGFNNNLGKELAKDISSNLSGLNFSNYLDLKKSINTNLYSIRKSMKKSRCL